MRGANSKCLRCGALLVQIPDAPPEEPPLRDSQGHPVVPFKPTFGGPASRVVVPLVAGVFTAAVLGFGAGFLRQYLWLVLVFPALLGMAIGYIVGSNAHAATCRRPDAVAFAGATAGLVGVVVMHYTGCVQAAANAPQLRPLGFFGYLDLRCEAGVEVAGLNLGYVGSVVYFLVEALVVVA
ncbi:MAG: hypothetical protein K2V38_23300, partial [Gemmataceae bacterium]|nr:hypothetical protein [Gemmataceae bacterium]